MERSLTAHLIIPGQKPLEFPLGPTPNIIAGWNEGIATMKVGGKTQANDSGESWLRVARFRLPKNPAECHVNFRG